MYIDDGKGKGIQAEISIDNQLMVKSSTNPSYAYNSMSKGTMFRWISSYAATAADFVMYLMNTDQANLFRINRVIFGSTVNTIWTMYKITGGTPAGTAITGVNLNWGSGKVATVTALGNAAVTGSPTGTIINYGMTLANTNDMVLIEGSIVMPVNTAWAIKASATGTVYVLLEGWFEPI